VNPSVISMATNILDQYVHSAPSDQNALDIFKGEWSAELPEPYAHLTAGKVNLFADARVAWFLKEYGDIASQSILELGPLEGAQSYLLEQAGAGSVLAIEANTKAYLRCLVLKEILRLKNVRYLCGDFTRYLQSTDQHFQLVFASGILYHMMNPMEVLANLARISSSVFIWTHYYEPAIVAQHQGIRNRFRAAERQTFGGYRYSQYRYHYEDALNWGGFCGGSSAYSYWLTRDDILGGLRHFGFRNIVTSFEEPNHPAGPALALIARK